ncbi:hypothetical protein R6Q59_016471 [Mikania micrantha]
MQRHQIYQGSFLGADLPGETKRKKNMDLEVTSRGPRKVASQFIVAVRCSIRAGLQFSVGRIRCCLKNGRYAKRVEIGVPVYLAAIFEYLVVEMIAGCSGTRVLPMIMLSKYTWLNSQMQPEGMNRAITTQLVTMYRDNYLVKRLQA